NEKLVLKQKLENKNIPKEPIRKGIEILEQLAKEHGIEYSPETLGRYVKKRLLTQIPTQA
ncbi:hypothetical protein AAA799P11_01422, partial [Marine Group I thaumarchaeote SCGC AAA799-P11]